MPALPSLFRLPIRPRRARCQSTNTEISSSGRRARAVYRASSTSRPASSSCRYKVTITMRRVACAISSSKVRRNAPGSGRQVIASAGTANAGSASGTPRTRRGNGNIRRAMRTGVVIRDLRSVMPSIIANPVARAYRCCPLAGTHRKLRAAQRRHAPRVAGPLPGTIGRPAFAGRPRLLVESCRLVPDPRNFHTDLSRVPDLAKYPELCWLDRCDRAIPVVLAVVLHASGVLLRHVAPQLGARGGQMLIWGGRLDHRAVSRHRDDQLAGAPLRPGPLRNHGRQLQHVWPALPTFGKGRPPDKTQQPMIEAKQRMASAREETRAKSSMAQSPHRKPREATSAAAIYRSLSPCAAEA